MHLKGFCYSVILLATLQCNYKNKAMRFGINCTPTIETNIWQIKSKHYVNSTSNNMGSSEIWDKYHECCIGNGDKFHEAKLPMLFPVNTILAVAMYAICHYVLNMHKH